MTLPLNNQIYLEKRQDQTQLFVMITDTRIPFGLQNRRQQPWSASLCKANLHGKFVLSYV